ncbi:TetR/AcrR family transcriptional regulator [Mycolicibacterium parafortuitum]|uniref:Putative transcriptional regulator [Amycolicicoccus subflavus DQS3-9A1] n=1 Tax=Mycolicibacterium parafortuitum TaxID=39692 RepID=A0A375YBJ7_MYCPF|nr:TetR/AcrR family transcriptional regulator [Mycolicibacterium parafortuitum]ORB31889.1 transcriptional regulator [Mycolicibacterium parafortuitum]SRX78475.1 putative transcriptional regulator [Amycolicicoccus subflavus DQS3-9A1] [Mycolicibacterium parafortuitum]
MTDAPRTYGGQSADARRRSRRTRLLDAATEAIADNAWRTLTVDRLCADAGLNKRYFYESFANLDEVAAAVVDDIAEDVRTATMSAAAQMATESLDRQAWAAVNALVHALAEDPRRGRILLGGVASSVALQEHRAAVMRGLTAVLVSHARSVHGVELEKDPLAEVAPAFIIGGTADAILAYLDGRAKLSLDDLVTALTTLWLITGNGAAEVARHRLGD